MRQRTEWAERSQTGVVEDFLELGGGLLTLSEAEGHLPRGARTAFPPGGRCRRAQRQINIVKLTHYRKSA